MPEEERRDNQNIGWKFDPELRNCPLSVFDDQLESMVTWWQEYRDLGVLPFGSDTLGDEPYFVGEVIQLCDAAANEWHEEHEDS